MNTLMRLFGGFAGALLASMSLAQDAGHAVSFLTCPIARDVGPDADLCFVADYQGERIALSNPPDFGMPQLRHKVLVEGLVHAEPGACGALRFEGRVSVMREISPECDTVLPYDGSFKAVAGGVFYSGSPAQRAHAQRLADRIPTDPKASIEPAILDPPETPPPVAPFTAQALVLTYPFGSTRASGPDMAKLKQLIDYARIARAHSITVDGFRGESRLTDGEVLREPEALAGARAELVAGVMRRLGVDGRSIHVAAHADAEAGSGHDDWRQRRVEVHLTP